MGRMYEHAMITVTELDGRLIQQQKVENTGRIAFDLTIPAGIYLVTVTTIDEVSVFRIVKHQ
jgi:hypothetical protein